MQFYKKQFEALRKVETLPTVPVEVAALVLDMLETSIVIHPVFRRVSVDVDMDKTATTYTMASGGPLVDQSGEIVKDELREKYISFRAQISALELTD